MNKELALEVFKMLVSEGGEKTSKTNASLSGRYIVIGNRGNIVVGDLTIDGDMGHLENASVIRRWGTSKGLGQLALEGKQPETELDPCGSFDFHVMTTCGMIKVESDL